MGALANAVIKASRPTPVTRRSSGVRGDDGRFTPASAIEVTVSLSIQPMRRELNRELQGDGTEGTIRVHAALVNLANAYLTADLTMTPLGWTELQVAPADQEQGPPGDRLIWRSREYEITNEDIWDDAGLIPDSAFRRYIATERGPS